MLDGVDPKRMSAAGFASYRPVATNATESGREKNRRVEIHFFGTKSDEEEKVKSSILDKAAKK
jgi:chemotaxis protein MotB